MKVLLDACVLFPSRLRAILLGAAAAGGFVPLWSPRILEEWARATRRLPEGAEAVARAEIAELQRRWPTALVAAPEGLEDQLSLPDSDDRHVLAAAIAGDADVLLTLNRADFPAGYWRGTNSSCASQTAFSSSSAKAASMSRGSLRACGPGPTQARARC